MDSQSAIVLVLASEFSWRCEMVSGGFEGHTYNAVVSKKIGDDHVLFCRPVTHAIVDLLVEAFSADRSAQADLQLVVPWDALN